MSAAVARMPLAPAQRRRAEGGAPTAAGAASLRFSSPRELTVLYDARCAFCTGVRHWLMRQRQIVPLRFLPAGSAAARRRFPALDHSVTLGQVTVVADTGAVYTEARAWVVCLWALRDYRGWAMRLAAPSMLPFTRRFVAWVSRRRSRLRIIGEMIARPW